MFSVGSYAKIWEFKKISEKYTDVRISTSVKDKATEKYEQDFSATVRCIGQAHQQIAYLSEKDTFMITKCGVSTKWDAEKKVMYTNYVVFEMDAVDPGEMPAKKTETEDNPFLKS